MKWFFCIFLFFNLSVNAQQWCGTKATNLFIDSGGLAHVRLAIRNDYVAFCNINSPWKNISPASCASWISLVRSGVARNADMIFYYGESTPCAQISTYSSAPAPGYIMMTN
jgi:hypothetical protein